MFACGIYSSSAQNPEEHIDSSILKIVNPEKDIKLWYGTDEFAISDFVVLPKYLLCYLNIRYFIAKHLQLLDY